jgi:signal transduction histidine kinase
MLDLTRLSQGVLPIAPARVELTEIARRVVERMSPQFQAKATPLDFSGDPQAYVHADPVRIEQVVLNLLTNVLRYAPGKPVSVEVRRTGDVIRLSVQDQGPGIAVENRERIFERYERLDPSLNTSGLGVGLYLSRMIVQGHAGRIFVEGAPAEGARFVVDLPPAGSSEALALNSPVGGKP